MTFPIPPSDELGDVYVHPRTNQRYVRGPNGVWQKVSIAADLEEYYVTQSDFTNDQLRQDNDIDQLETKVKALEGTVVDDAWTFEDRAATPRDGEFTILNNGVLATRFEEATSIAVSATSKNGNVYDFQNIVVGDVIRLAKSINSLAEYQITGILPDGIFTVDVIRAVGEPVDETDYDFVFLSSYDPAGLATIEYVDLQDDLRLKKTGGSLSGDLVFKREFLTASLVFHTGAANGDMVIYAANGRTVRFRSSLDDVGNIGRNTHFAYGKNINTNLPETFIYHLQDPQEETWAANKRYVDTAALPIGGGTVTGTLKVQGASFYMNNSSGEETFRIQSSGFCRTNDLFRVTRDIKCTCVSGTHCGCTEC